jgi:CheY-like chemotaxis protein
MTPRILLIDDDRVSQSMIKIGLRAANFEVISALDGQSALTELRFQRPDLIILDIHMPGMSGFEFLNEIKSNAEFKDIPVIIASANDNMQDMFISQGVKGYLVKPVDLKQLKNLISSCIKTDPEDS